MKIKTWTVTGIALLGVFGLSACGSSNQHPAASTNANTNVGTQPTAQTTAQTNAQNTTQTTVQVPGTTIPSQATALIYAGNGTCSAVCTQSMVSAATAAGLIPAVITGTELTSTSTAAEINAFFQMAKVLIMPGGLGADLLTQFDPTLLAALQGWLSNGGGIVSFGTSSSTATSILNQLGLGNDGILTSLLSAVLTGGLAGLPPELQSVVNALVTSNGDLNSVFTKLVGNGRMVSTTLDLNSILNLLQNPGAGTTGADLVSQLLKWAANLK